MVARLYRFDVSSSWGGLSSSLVSSIGRVGRLFDRGLVGDGAGARLEKTPTAGQALGLRPGGLITCSAASCPEPLECLGGHDGIPVWTSPTYLSVLPTLLRTLRCPQHHIAVHAAPQPDHASLSPSWPRQVVGGRSCANKPGLLSRRYTFSYCLRCAALG